MSDDFDGWLDGELGRRLADVDPGYVAPRYLESRRGRPSLRRRAALLGGLPLPAIFATKAAAASLVVLAATGTGVAVTTAAGGNTDLQVWGQQVKDQVQKCKDALPAGEHGIGKCVSAFAKQHGQAQQSAHPEPSESPEAGDNDGKGKSDSHPTPHAGGNGKGNGESESHPTPPASPQASHPTAPAGPTGHPTGKP
jgi:hypothetical protein